MAQGGGDKGGQDKSEKPTPKRLRDARKKGQVWHSQDFTTLAVLIATFMAFGYSISYVSSEIKRLMRTTFDLIAQPSIPIESVFHLLSAAFTVLVKVSIPVASGALLGALFIAYLQVGPVFSMEPLKPQINRLNVIEGLKNMFKSKNFIELIKNIIKISFIFIIAFLIVKGVIGDFLMTLTLPLEQSIQIGSLLVTQFLVRVFILFLLLAIMDLYIQRRDYMKQLMMTKEEVKREYKEDEGDPLIKSARKQIHMEMAMGDTRQAVKTADVVVTNPTHLAVVIKYNAKEMAAPQIVAKGQRLFAEYIRELAKEFDIPVLSNIPLAWSLVELEIGDEVPAELYQAVAEILTFVYKMKEGKGESPMGS
ncbi:MAG: EscU/YscU/HrcU family type III secretion system export apparatus switch protein [Deltaproteobacteria bacterium]|nr:EscU/YscU/HrcU family type III secretion system export apparatus switch protein [Deltaproteobacteria bacterium]